jgi:DNA polymerase I-like protein with 3'-5' exonuclease and polymerase domains
MSVIVWTSSNKANFLRRVAEPVFGVTGTDHRVEPLRQGKVPDVHADDVLIAMGGACLDLMKQYGAVNKNRTIGSLRQKAHDFPPGKLLVSYDPGEIVYDLQLACRLHDHGTLKPKVGKYKYVENFNKVLKQIKKAYSIGMPVYVAGDLETIGFDPFYKSEIPWHLDEGEPEPDGYYPDARIVSISFTVEPGTAYVYQVPESGIDPDVRDQIELILTSPKVKTTGANWKFDMGWILEHWGIMCTNHKFDTGIVGCLIDENRSNSLNLHAKIYTGMGGYDDDFNQNHDKARMDLVLKEDPKGFLTYAGGDTDACLRVTNQMRPRLLEDERLTNFYVNLLQPASDVFTKLEHRGVYVDEKQYDVLQKQCEEELVEYHNKGLQLMSRKLRLKFEAEMVESAEDKMSLTRPTLIKEFLFTKRGLNLKPTMFSAKAKEETWEYASTAAEHLETFAQNEDAAQFIECYSGFNGAKKTLSTYILGFRKHLRSDGMFHPSYNLYKGDFGGKGDDSGTVTGRLSTRDPAYQTIPKHTKWAKPLRTVYVAPPGYAILKLDYSQGELRVAACVAQEERMIAAYKAGIDMHLKTGAETYGITLKKAQKWLKKQDPRVKAVRQGGKAGNFGLLYGMSPNGFVNYAWNTYGVEYSQAEATAVSNAFFEMYPGLVQWHEDSKNLARSDLQIRNPLGRIRHLPLINSRNYKSRGQAERQSINSPIQSCLSDMMLLAMVLIDREYPELHMFGMTHDEMQCYVPEDEVDIWAERIGDIMSNLPLEDFGWNPELSFPADAEWSTTNLAECVEL